MPVKDEKKGTTPKAQTNAKAQAKPPVASPEIKADATPATPEPQAQPAKPEKVLIPKDWQKVVEEEGGKKHLVNVITFMGEQMEYEPGHKEEYFWPNLTATDGLKRVVTAKFPKSEVADSTESIDVFGYTLKIDSYGNSKVCRLEKDGEVILDYVSLATVLDVLQDELNPKGEDGKGTCNMPWGTIDQVIKYKRGLKSRIKNLGDDDLPLRSRRNKDAQPEGGEGNDAAAE